LGHAAQGIAVAILTGSRRLLLGLLLVCITSGFVFLLLSQRGYQKDTLNRWTFDSRVAVWKIGLKEVVSHPLVGIGYGNNSFIKRFPKYAVSEQEQFSEQARVLPSMHSAFLMVMVGSGLPGCISFVWLFVVVVQALIRPSAIGELHRTRIFGWGVAIAVIGFGVRNLFDSMFIGSLAHLFWLLAAAGIAITNPTDIWGTTSGSSDSLPADVPGPARLRVFPTAGSP
jgi:O-antigen ligase